MPIYEYRCENGHNFEAFQSMSDDSLDTCEVCDAPAQRVLSAPAVHFKGSGFYTTDYARKGAKTAAVSGGSSEGGADSKSESDSGSGSGSSGSGSGSASGGSSNNSSGGDSASKSSGSESKSSAKASSSSD